MALREGFNWPTLAQNVQEELKQKLPPVIAALGRNTMLNAFRDQGQDGKDWKEVKRRVPGTQQYKYPKSYGLQRRTNPIGRGGGFRKGSAGGTLRRDVSNSISQVSFDEIKYHVKTPYAGYFNDDRPFVPNSDTFDKLIEAKIDYFMQKALNP